MRAKNPLIKWNTLVFTCLAFFLPIPTVCATIFYVDAQHGSDTNPGISLTSAWKTLEKINKSQFSPGDQILLRRDGLWYGELLMSSSGLPNNPIVIGAYGFGDDPTIDSAASYDSSIRIFQGGYIKVQDIRCLNWRSRGIYTTNANGITVERCTVSGGDGTSPDHGIQIQRSSGELLTDIVVRNNRVGAISHAVNDTVFYSGITVQGVQGAVIRGNYVATHNTSAIHLIGGGVGRNMNCYIEQNEISGCYSGIFIDSSDETVVRYNSIRNGKGLGVGVNHSNKVEIYYNIISDLEPSDKLWNGIDINHDSQDGQVLNNTIFKVYRHCLMIDDETEACNGWIVMNNIFDASQNAGSVRLSIGIRGSIRYNSDHNVLWAGGGPVASFGDFGFEDGDLYEFLEYQAVSGQDSHSIYADPEFADVGSRDFRLRRSSPCVDAGIDAGLIRDISGIGLPQGESVDVGAYELEIPSPPQNLRLQNN